MQRVERLELLDKTGGNISPGELAVNLVEIARLNRLTGTTAALMAALDRLVGKRYREPLRIVDIGTGSGDLPRALIGSGRYSALHVIGADLNRMVLDYARTANPGSDWLQLNGAQLPFADQAIDVAICAQTIHHLASESIHKLLLEMRRVSRMGFIVMDLERSRLAQLVIWLLTRLTTRNRLTLHDGPLSAARAYTGHEIAAIAENMEITLEIMPVFPFRWIGTWKR
jgi:ubiquinone/menaquinone biosynthesis C-methylase UbiE